MATYSVIPVLRDGVLCDIAVESGGKKRHMWGRRGARAELALADALEPGELPVLLGAGLGELLGQLARRGPVAVYDDQPPISDVTRSRQRMADAPNVLWLDGAVEDSLRELEKWRQEQGGGRLRVLSNPLYLRQFPGVYGRLDAQLRQMANASVWNRLRHPRFVEATPRVLLLSSEYFLVRELRAAMNRLGWAHHALDLSGGFETDGAYAEELLTMVAEFRPDFLLTVNHFGVDEGGGLFELLERLRLPLASWFVDAPFLTLSLFENARTDWCSLFSFDRDNVAPLRDAGFPNVHWLPLATDPHVFSPHGTKTSGALSAGTIGAPLPTMPEPVRDVAFVGHSGARLVARRLKLARFPARLLREYKQLAEGFLDAPEQFASQYVRRVRPDLMPHIEMLPVPGAGWYWSLLTRQATRVYRRRCLSELMDFSPTIAGDRWWRGLLREHEGHWREHGTLDYYTDLPGFYASTSVNFNMTDRQMPGAPNQRVFDCPAAGGFLLTDRREQLHELFDADTELALYDGAGEVAERVRWYLRNPEEREVVTARARCRILNEHTYDHRLRALLRQMREVYGAQGGAPAVGQVG